MSAGSVRHPAVGDPAPEIELPDADGTTVRLSDLRGGPVVVYFYPRDDTPGCTTQACGIRDAWSEFRAAGATVLGISPDDPASHTAFAAKHELPFTLLADTERVAAEAYGVWVEKTMYGKKRMGIERSTFVIDADGRVAMAWRRAKPAEHAERVLGVLAELGGASAPA